MSDNEMSGRVCIVTGANSGLGLATSKALASMGASLVMVCRDSAKGDKARSEVMKGAGRQSGVDLLYCDLSSLNSVRELARDLLANYPRIHALINNAGVFNLSRKLTVDGFENTFAVNYLSQFLLTNLLLERLVASAPSRIVVVSSTSHYNGHIDFDDIQANQRYSGFRAYSQSKLAQVLFTHELAGRLRGTRVTVNSLHPGAVATNIWSRPAGRFGFITSIFKPFLLSPKKGAETIVFLTSSQQVGDLSGEYFEKKLVKESSAESYDTSIAERLWNESARLAGLDPRTRS